MKDEDINFDYMPTNPVRMYKNKGWINSGDFLGTYKAPNQKVVLPFEEAKKFVHSLKLKSQKEWQEYCKSGKKPNNISSCPYRVYKDKGWTGWGDFLGTNTIASRNKVFVKFEEARKFACSLGLKSQKEWNKYCKSGNKPNNIPAGPNNFYKNQGWKGWGDFLGTGNVHKKNFLSFENAREFICSIGLKTSIEWKEYSRSNKRPKNIPGKPDIIYKDKWISWKDFLGY